ncbi:TPD1 protein homolog 1 [Vigna angularis]|nr:TPD1 protein homolog 1 [Vigna angularis]
MSSPPSISVAVAACCMEYCKIIVPYHSAINMIITNSIPLIIFLCFTMPHFLFCDEEVHSGQSTQILHSFYEDRNGSITVSVKAEDAASKKKSLHGSCTKKDISISQSTISTTGIPQFVVQIENTCVSGCPPHDIHLHCGWFASARLVNPKLFKRISYDDCLVNGGNPLAPSQIIKFAYSNSFIYPLALKSAKFCGRMQI